MKKITLVLLSIILILCSVQISAQINFNNIDYKEPAQLQSTILPPFFKMRRVLPPAGAKGNPEHPPIEGDIMRVLNWKNYSIVLSHTKDRDFTTKTKVGSSWKDTEKVSYYTPHLYIVEHEEEENGIPTGRNILYVLNLPTSNASSPNGLITRDNGNLGDYCNLSDIAFDADGYLIGCNYIRMYEQYNLPRDASGEWGPGEDHEYNQAHSRIDYKEGVFCIYKWSHKIEDVIETLTYNETLTDNLWLVGTTPTDYIPQKWIKLKTNNKKAANFTGVASSKFNWVTGNYPRAETGYSLAVSGSSSTTTASDPFWITFTCERTPSYESDYDNEGTYDNKNIRDIVLRFVHLPIVNNTVQEKTACVSIRKPVDNASDNITSVGEFKVKKEVGQWYELHTSPFTEGSWVIDGPLCTPHEFVQNSVNNTAYDYEPQSSNSPKNSIKYWQGEWKAASSMTLNEGAAKEQDLVGKFPVSPCFFRYGRKNVMLYPKQEGNYITGFELWEVSTTTLKNNKINKLAAPTKVQLITSMDVKSGFKSFDITNTGGRDPYYKAIANVEGADITIYFWRDLKQNNNLTRTVETYTTKGVEQGRGIYAYGLSSSFDSHINEYTFNFKLNEYPYKAVLKLYKESANGGGATEKKLIASHILINNGTPQNYVSKILKPGDLYEVKIAGNKLTVEDGKRQAEPGTKLTWAIEVTDTTVYNWQHVENHWFQGEASFAAVDNSPESPYMGNVYRWDNGGNNNTAGVRQYTFIKNSGASIDPQEHENTTATTPSNLSSSGRFAVDEAGNLYMPGSDGVYVIEPNALGTATKWENKTIKNIKTVATYGKGKDEVLIIVQTSNSNYSNNATITTYGKEDDDVTAWDQEKPLSVIEIDKTKYLSQGSDLNIVPTAYGYFVINHCWQKENSIANRTLMFFKKDNGTKKTSKESFRNFTNEPEYASITDGRKYNNNQQFDAIYGSHGAGAAITSDEGVFILHSWRPKKKDENGNYVYDYEGKFSVYEMNWGRLPRENQSQTDASVFNNSNLFLQDSEQFYFYTNDHDWNYIRQMHFDYGGNLVIAGDKSNFIYVAEYAVPKLKTTQIGRVYEDKGNYKSDANITPIDTTSIIPADDWKLEWTRPRSTPDTRTYTRDQIINRTETPTQSITEYNTEQCDDYDRVFTNAAKDNNWSNPANWIPNPQADDPNWQTMPYPDHRVRIDAPVKIEGMTNATAGYIDINKGATDAENNLLNPTLTITPTGGLTVGGQGVNTLYNDAQDAENNAVEGLINNVPSKNQTIGTNPTLRTDRNKTADGTEQLLSETDIVIQAGGVQKDENGKDILGTATQGSLALHNITRMNGTTATDISNNKNTDTKATVEIYGQYPYPSKDAIENENATATDLTWQYIGVPFYYPEAANSTFRYAWMYRWSEKDAMWYILSGWGHHLNKFQGYLLTQEETGRKYTMTGTLHESGTVTINSSGTQTDGMPILTFAGSNSYKGANFLANSWTAPLQIAKFTTYSAFTNCDATIYLYAPKARQYVAVPIGQTAAIGITQINPLQGFFVLANNTSASVKLDYARLVSTTEQSYLPDSKLDAWANLHPQTTPSAAQRRTQAAEQAEKEQEMMRIHVQGNDGSTDDIILFQNEDYTLGFDNGYDGRKMLGGEGTPYFTACAADGDMAVLATPAFYGTTLHFRRGTAKEYTLSFDYDAPDSDLVLQDLLTKTYVEIRTGNTYTFTAADDNLSKRFRITRRSTEMVEYEPDAYVVQGKLYVDNPTDEVIGVALFSVDGKLISHFGTRDALCELEVPCEGVYIVHLTTSKGTKTVKQVL